MQSRWSAEVWRIVLVLLPFALLGWLNGFLAAGLILGLMVALGYYIYKLHQLLRWILGSSDREVPDSSGIWGDLYHRISQLQRNNQERQRQLSGMLDQFQRSAEAMPDATVSLGRYWDIRWFNDAASRLLGLRPKRDIGQPIVNLLRSPQFQAYLKSRSFDGSVEIKAPGDDQSRLSIRIIPYGEEQYLLLAQDVTERHRLERVRKDFVANVSHELRTPLTVISGFVENLQHDESGCGEKWRRPLNLMRQQTDRMQRIVEDLLLLASLEGAQGPAGREIVDVGSMLEEIVEETQAAMGSGEERTLQLEADAGALYGNPLQLRSAFSNLVTNANKYTAPGGRIDVRWRVGDSGAVLEVEDTGDGIAAEHIPRLTERFYRVDVGRSREKGGTGLGLAIVKHVLQRHGATLEIRSKVGEGSCFRCLFPLDRLVSDRNDLSKDRADGHTNHADSVIGRASDTAY